ncbi:MAG: VWA domain-containing protein [Capnocytophaga sp.]|nr:VWA domain-containing protein [Capnocytophaga sp.]
MIHIEQAIYLWAILGISLFFILFLLHQWRKKKQQKLFAKEPLLRRLSPDRSSFKPWVKFSLFSLMLAGLLAALANPKVGTQIQTVKREGVDVVFAIDVSKSMLAEDVSPNRLDKAKRIVSETIGKLKGDRVGIVAYAASAYPQLPLTTDYSIARMFLQNMNTDMLSSQGTNIHEAIRMAVNYFDETQPTARILIIISDGEDHEMGATEIASEALEQGVHIFTIGVGTERGGPIPVRQAGNQSLKRDANGEVVITRMNPQLLEQIANSAGGQYISGDNTNEAVEKIGNILDGTEKNEFETQQMVDYKSQFQWFLGLAILAWLLDMIIFERKTQWVRKINLFNEKK